MIIITLRRKMLKAAAIIMVSILAVSTFFYLQYKDSENKLELLISSSGISDKTSLTAFMISKSFTARASKIIEIFDVKKGKVVKQVESTNAIQTDARSFLENINGLYVKVKAFPDDGFIIRVPLESPVKVQNQWLTDTVEEIFIIFPQNKTPYLLILDKMARPRFYTFAGNTAELLKNLDYQPTAVQE